MTIQYIMLVSLGFLIASLITLLLAPIFWQRAVRLTSTRLRQSMPLTEQEILADKDQLRAKYAIRVHQLEKQIELATLGGARQKIDLNRRDASITQLETEIELLKSQIEESQNARSVLEQTVSDRIPKIEARLEEARKLLNLRDKEIADLSQSGRRQSEALNEARVISQKQSADIELLRSQLRAYEAQARRKGGDADQEGDLAIRTELEVLRARSREQASLIDRLNGEIVRLRAEAHSALSSSDEGNATHTPGIGASGAKRVSANEPANDTGSPAAEHSVTDDEIARLRTELGELQAQLERARETGAALVEASQRATDADPAAAEREVTALKAKVEDQATEIAKLTTELAATAGVTRDDAAAPTLRDNRIALKARLSGLEAKSNQQTETIQRLRAELAQANERAARQAASFLDEMRRLGVAAHVTQPRTGRPLEAATKPRSVAKRTQALFDAARPSRPAVDGTEPAEGTTDNSTARPLAGDATVEAPNRDAENAPAAAVPLGRRLAVASGEGSGSSTQSEGMPPVRVASRVAALRPAAAAGTAAHGAAETAPVAKDPPQRQARLADRITAVDRKS